MSLLGSALRHETQRGTADETLATLGALVARAHHDVGAIDDVDLQNMSLESGVLVWVRATEPCGTACVCARVARFPLDCLTMPDDVAAATQRILTRNRT